MDQELTISKNIINYLSINPQGYRTTNVIKCVDIIEQNFFVCDFKLIHLTKFQEEIDKLENPELRNRIDDLFKYWRDNKLKQVEFDYKESSESELLMTELTEDKIFIDVSMTFQNC